MRVWFVIAHFFVSLIEGVFLFEFIGYGYSMVDIHARFNDLLLIGCLKERYYLYIRQVSLSDSALVMMTEFTGLQC